MLYAITDKNGKQLTKAATNRSKAWNNYFLQTFDSIPWGYDREDKIRAAKAKDITSEEVWEDRFAESSADVAKGHLKVHYSREYNLDIDLSDSSVVEVFLEALVNKAYYASDIYH